MTVQAPRRWPAVVVLLHWTTAVLALATAGYGIWLLSPPDWSQPYLDRYEQGIGLHKLGGVAIFVLALCWLAIRLRHGRPPMAGSRGIRRLVRTVHVALFLLLILLPVSGYVMESLGGRGIDLPGGLAIPPLLSEDDKASMALSYVHKWAGYALLPLVALHLSGAVRRALAPGDTTLAAMLPGWLVGG